MSAPVVDMGGVTYGTGDLAPAEHHALTMAVHEALTALGMEPWVHVPAGAFRPNLARQTTERSWSNR